MKLLTTIFVLVFASATAFASIDPLDITVQRDVTSGTLIIRSIVGVEHAALVEIYDDLDNRLYADTVVAGGFINKRFPLQGFGRDKLFLIITDEEGRTTQPIKLKTNGNLAEAANAQHLLFPKVDLRDQRMLVVDYKNRGGHRVDITIANTAGETVFSDSVNGREEVQRAYRLDQLAEGDYQLIVSARDVKKHTTAFALR